MSTKKNKRLLTRFFLILPISLLISFVGFGCQQEISESSAKMIAKTKVTQSFNEKVWNDHKITDIQFKDVLESDNLWLFTYNFKDKPSDEIVITIDHYGNIANSAFWIGRESIDDSNHKSKLRSQTTK